MLDKAYPYGQSQGWHRTSSVSPEVLNLLATHEITVHREPDLSHSWIPLAMMYLSAFSPSSCSIRWRWQCQLVSQKTRWQSTHIRSCLFLQGVKKTVSSTHSLYSAVWQSLLILPAFLQERVVFTSYLIFSFYNKKKNSITHAVLWQAVTFGIWYQDISKKPESWHYRAMLSGQALINVPLQAASRPRDWAWFQSGTEDIHFTETIDTDGKICPLSQVVMDHCKPGKQTPQ